MTYLQHQALKPEDFKRLFGVHQGTFTQMVNVVREQVEQKKKKPGKPSKLSVEDQVLMSLKYHAPIRTTEMTLLHAVSTHFFALLPLISNYLIFASLTLGRIVHPLLP